jgi:hypothetical protein
MESTVTVVTGSAPMRLALLTAVAYMALILDAAQADSPIPFELKWSLTQGPARSTYVVIRSQDQWQQMRDAIRTDYVATQNVALAPTPEKMPVIDFNRFMLVVAAAGRKSTGGYSISITRIDNSPNSILVHVVETTPGENCAGTAMSTAPFAGAQIPIMDKSVNFDIKKVISSC